MSKSIGQVIQEKRKAKGWTQERLGKKIGINANTLGSYERDQAIPNLLTAYAIAQALECSLYELLDTKESYRWSM